MNVWGEDIRVCKYVMLFCQVCNEQTQMALYEKSKVAGLVFIPLRSNRRYHLMCHKCKTVFNIDENQRKEIYQTFFEKVFYKVKP